MYPSHTAEREPSGGQREIWIRDRLRGNSDGEYLVRLSAPCHCNRCGACGVPVRRYRQGAADANHRAGGGSATLGFGHDASTYGGAILASYAVNDNVSVAGRAEYISSSGSIKNGAPNLLYGPGSSAWSVTFTPTYQEGIWFVREELSYVLADSTTPGLAFGRSGNRKSQARVMIEGGIIF